MSGSGGNRGLSRSETVGRPPEVEAGPGGPAPLVEVSDLHVDFATEEGVVHAVDGVSFQVGEGEIVAIVGESGSGKSATALSLIGLTREAGAGLSGSVLIEGVDMLRAPARRLRSLRGAEVSIVFQDPLSSLNPVHRIGDQIVEQIRAHREVTRAQAGEQALDALRRAGMPEPERRMRSYPHELSGGQRQRAMIAIALSCDPRLLIADEPTTALDVTVQAKILRELRRLRDESGMAIVLVTHDLAVVAGIADRVLVMHAGRIVEEGDVAEIFERPRHERTKALLAAIVGVESERPATPEPGGGATPAGRAERAEPDDTPGGDDARRALPGARSAPDRRPLLSLQGVSVEFAARRARGEAGQMGGGVTKALDDVDVDLFEGEALGVVGESGCGKTTLIRCAARLQEVASGTVRFEEQDITRAGRRALKPVRRGMQVVFQDPEASLNPRKRVSQILSVPLRIRGVGRKGLEGEVASLLEEVGLDAAHANRYPHELSGGQRQRVGIARALALRPKVLLLDEPVSSLDVTVRSQIVELLFDLRERHRLSCIFVAHDIALVRHVSDRIAVMAEGRIVEIGDPDEVCGRPSHPATRELLAAVPEMPRTGSGRRAPAGR